MCLTFHRGPICFPWHLAGLDTFILAVCLVSPHSVVSTLPHTSKEKNILCLKTYLILCVRYIIGQTLGYPTRSWGFLVLDLTNSQAFASTRHRPEPHWTLHLFRKAVALSYVLLSAHSVPSTDMSMKSSLWSVELRDQASEGSWSPGLALLGHEATGLRLGQRPEHMLTGYLH